MRFFYPFRRCFTPILYLCKIITSRSTRGKSLVILMHSKKNEDHTAKYYPSGGI